jgi:hypothetical protein
MCVRERERDLGVFCVLRGTRGAGKEADDDDDDYDYENTCTDVLGLLHGLELLAPFLTFDSYK